MVQSRYFTETSYFKYFYITINVVSIIHRYGNRTELFHFFSLTRIRSAPHTDTWPSFYLNISVQLLSVLSGFTLDDV